MGKDCRRCRLSVILGGAQRSRRISRRPVGDPSLSLRMTGKGGYAGKNCTVCCPFIPYMYGARAQHVRSTDATRCAFTPYTLRTKAPYFACFRPKNDIYWHDISIFLPYYALTLGAVRHTGRGEGNARPAKPVRTRPVSCPADV